MGEILGGSMMVGEDGVYLINKYDSDIVYRAIKLVEQRFNIKKKTVLGIPILV